MMKKYMLVEIYHPIFGSDANSIRNLCRPAGVRVYVCMYVCVYVCVCVCMCVCYGNLVDASPQSLYMVQLSYGGTLIAHGPQMCTWGFFWPQRLPKVRYGQ